MPEWDPEIAVDGALARRLIAEQFPALAAWPLRRVGEGWDNAVWVNDQSIAFRFPRRAIAVPGVLREIAILPTLAPQVPAAIPDARHIAAATPAFPWPWFGSRLIDGQEIATADLGPRSRGALASELGAFLRGLHSLSPPAGCGLEVDPLGRTDMQTRIPRARAAVDAVTPLWDGRERAEPIFATAAAREPDRETVLAHGDLNLRHALVSETGGLAGVIDWGDMCVAPRAIDLPLYWSLFGPGDRDRFRDAYGPVTESALAHARVLALFMDATLAAYAHERGMAALERETLRSLDVTVSESA